MRDMTVTELFTAAWTARPHIERILAAPPPVRALVVGTAGSGKSDLLDDLHAVLTSRSETVHRLEDGVDIAALPPEDVLVVDDVHLQSEPVVHQLATRAQDPNAGLVVALRPWPRTPLLLDLERRLQQSAPPVILGLVSAAQVHAYLRTQGRSAPEQCVDELIALTGGAAWLVTYALAREHPEDCTGGEAHADMRRDLQDQVLQRLDTRDAPLRRMIEYSCLGAEGDGPDLGTETMDDLVLRGFAEGLLLRNGTPLPVVQAAVYASLSYHWKVANGDALADGLARAVIGTHQAADLLNGVHDPRVGEAIVERADRLIERDPERAGELYDAALAAGVDEDVMAVRRARAAWATGHLDEAAHLVDEALTRGESPPQASQHQIELVDTSAAIWAARDMMAMASEAYGLSAALENEASAVRARIARLGSGLPEPRDSRDDVLARASMPSTLGIALRLLDRGLEASLAGDPPPETLSELVRASDLYTASGSTHPVPELPAVIAASVALGSGDLEIARQVLDAAVDGGQGGSWARRRLLLWQGLVAVQAERPADARRALAAAEQEPFPVSPRDTRLRHTLDVTLARRYADLPTLEAAWARVRAAVAHPDVDLYTLFPLANLLGVAARLGDATTLAPHLRMGLDLLQRLGSPPAWSTHLWWAGVQQGILLNQPQSLAPFAKALVEVADRSQLAATMASAGGTWVSVLAGKVDPEAVESAARALGAVGLAWDGGRLAAHGARRTKNRRASARLLACARDLHPTETTGNASVDEGGKAAAASTESQLSEREFEVARLILRGKTYVEIGEALFISPRTVEHHVAHMRRRLEATSRSDLIAKLRLQIEPPEAVTAAHEPPSGNPRTAESAYR